jgi:hypothetical protein
VEAPPTPSTPPDDASGAPARTPPDTSWRREWGFWVAVGWAVLLAGVCAAIATGRPSWLHSLDIRRLFR